MTRRSTMTAMAALLLAVPLAVPAGAQRPGAGGPPGDSAERAALEQQVRERMWQVVQERVQLTDDQMRQLAEVERRIAPDRQRLMREEMAARAALRAEVLAVEPNQARIDTTLRRMLTIQRRRLDLVEREHTEIARFMTPLQRARYHAVQDQIRRRMEDLREGRRGGPDAEGGRRPGMRPPGMRPAGPGGRRPAGPPDGGPPDAGPPDLETVDDTPGASLT